MKNVKTSSLILIGFAIIFVVPWFLTRDWLSTFVTYTETGQIGDTIGGTTAPFLSLLGSVLLFLALKEQIKANKLIVRQFELEQNEKEISNLYGYWEKSIEIFSFSSLPYTMLITNEQQILDREAALSQKSVFLPAKERMATTDDEKIEHYIEQKQSGLNKTAIVNYGSKAIHQCLTQVVCQSHANYDELCNIAEIKHLISIFEVANELMNRIQKQESNTKTVLQQEKPHVYRLLVYQQFRYHFAKDWFDQDLKKTEECPDCKHTHGLPDDLYKSYSNLQRHLDIIRKPFNS